MEPIIQIGETGLDLIHLVAIVVALALAAAAYRLNEQFGRERTVRAEAEADLAHASQELKTQRARAEDANLKLARLEARSEEDERRFSDIASDAVQKAHQHFLQRADLRFEKLVEPVGKSFEKFEKKVDEIGKDRAAMGKQLEMTGSMLKQNFDATSQLVTALSSPKGGGQWGEESLKRALNYAGLEEHVDFKTQVTINNDRPDAMVHLPNGRSIVIDAKVSAAEFLMASSEPDAGKRHGHIQAHARHVKENMKRLSAKAYQTRIPETADFVVMYIPGENMFSAALSEEPTLFEEAFNKGVVIASPSTLVALAKTVALGWREAKMAQNAREVAELGRELYKSLRTFGVKVQGVGTHLERSVKAYNEFVGSLENNVMPKGRKFEELGSAPADLELAKIEQVDRSVRMLKPGKDVELDVIDYVDEDNRK